MKNNSQVSVPVIKRLPRYHRYLEELKNMGVVRISSKELSLRMGLTASQIRQDLNCFGGFGQQGYGYNIEQLYNEIGLILGINKRSKAIMIGAGNLGHAIATHLHFENRGFDLNFDGYEAEVESIFRALIARDKGIEVNTNRGNAPLPGEKWLRMYRDLGGRIITLGSDAHVDQHVGWAIRERQELLKRCGFTEFCTFEKMQPIWHEL